MPNTAFELSREKSGIFSICENLKRATLTVNGGAAVGYFQRSLSYIYCFPPSHKSKRSTDRHRDVHVRLPQRSEFNVHDDPGGCIPRITKANIMVYFPRYWQHIIVYQMSPLHANRAATTVGNHERVRNTHPHLYCASGIPNTTPSVLLTHCSTCRILSACDVTTITITT